MSNTQMLSMDIAPKGLIPQQVARPFHMTFIRQQNTARALYGKQLALPQFSRKELMELLQPSLQYYAKRDQALIADRVCEVILTRQKKLKL